MIIFCKYDHYYQGALSVNTTRSRRPSGRRESGQGVGTATTSPTLAAATGRTTNAHGTPPRPWAGSRAVRRTCPTAAEIPPAVAPLLHRTSSDRQQGRPCSRKQHTKQYKQGNDTRDKVPHCGSVNPRSCFRRVWRSWFGYDWRKAKKRAALGAEHGAVTFRNLSRWIVRTLYHKARIHARLSITEPSRS